jgi:hypothetical protein
MTDGTIASFRHPAASSNPSPSLHPSPTRDLDRLTVHIAEQRRHNSQNRACRFRGGTGSAQWNVLVRRTVISFARGDLLAWDSQCHALAVSRGDEGTCLLRPGQSGVDVPIGNRVCTDTELLHVVSLSTTSSTIDIPVDPTP